MSIHIPDADQINPPTLAQQLNEMILAATGTKPEIDHNPAGHAFLNEEDLLGTYDAAQAKIAWDRTVAFLGSHVGQEAQGPGPRPPVTPHPLR